MLNQNSGEIHNAGMEVQAAWRIARDWSVDANYSFLHMESPLVAAPEHKLYVGGLFTHGRWHVSTGVQYIANIRASFRILDWMSVWVRGENLLNQRYEINAGFPMPGANVIGGLGFEF